MSRPLTPTPIRPISSKTIECDPVGFANWLNDLADLLNYTNQLTIDNWNLNRELLRRVECLEVEVEEIKERLVLVESRLDSHEERIIWLEDQFSAVDGIFGMVNLRLDWIFNRLPFAVGNVPPNWTFAGGDVSLIHTDIADDGDIYQIVNLVDDKVNWYDQRLPRTKASMPADFKMAFGNINVMSANSGTPSLNVGIFTSNAIENNDLYFN